MSNTAVADQATDAAATTETESKDASPKTSPKKNASAKKSPKKKATPKKAPNANGSNRSGILTLHQANAAALKTGEAQDVGSVFVIPLSAIKEYDNPRVEPEALYQQGYILFGDPRVEEATDTQFVSLIHLALDDDIDNVRQYVELIEQYEGPICKLIHTDPDTKKETTVFTGTEHFCNEKKSSHSDAKHCKVERHLSAPQSIVELADDISLFEQLNPVQVQKAGSKYVMVEGGRRSAAILYLHAKSRVLRHDKAEDAPKSEFPATIKATDLKCGKDDLFVMSGIINLSRKQFTPMQEGRFYYEMCQRINPATEEKFTMKDAAERLGVEYSTFRNRHALWMPFKPAKVDEKGRVVKPSKGLTDADRRKVALNEMTVTAASRKALGERHYSDTGKPASNRNRGLPLNEMQKLFDSTAEDNEVRRQAIADCMGIPLAQAVKESEKRIQEQDRIDLAKQTQKSNQRRKKTKTKAA